MDKPILKSGLTGPHSHGYQSMFIIRMGIKPIIVLKILKQKRIVIIVVTILKNQCLLMNIFVRGVESISSELIV